MVFSGGQNLGVGKKGRAEAMLVGEELKGAVKVVEGGSRRRNMSNSILILICFSCFTFIMSFLVISYFLPHIIVHHAPHHVLFVFDLLVLFSSP